MTTVATRKATTPLPIGAKRADDRSSVCHWCFSTNEIWNRRNLNCRRSNACIKTTYLTVKGYCMSSLVNLIVFHMRACCAELNCVSANCVDSSIRLSRVFMVVMMMVCATVQSTHVVGSLSRDVRSIFTICSLELFICSPFIPSLPLSPLPSLFLPSMFLHHRAYEFCSPEESLI